MPLSVAYGSASADDRVSVSTSPLLFKAGATTAYVTLKVAGDSTTEPNETLTVTLGTPAGATPGAYPSTRVTIKNDD